MPSDSKHKLDCGTPPDGVIIIDKPADMTSAAVVNRIKRLTGVRKAGHTGTLDPFATGVMICPINRATRLARFFLGDHKKYAATLHLGIDTDTQDHTGNPIAVQPVGDIPADTIERVFAGFVGPLEQVPPAFSALKHKGVPLYRYAREGRPVQKEARPVHIFSIEIRSIQLPDIDFEVECSSGTYIRTLCADIGRALGCGGHLKSLVRLKSSGFTMEDAFSLSCVEEKASANALTDCVVPMTEALRGIATFRADDELRDKIVHGRPLTMSDVPWPVDSPNWPYVKLTDAENRLLAVIHIPENKFEYQYCCVFQSP